MIEKPFGFSLESAGKLNAAITKIIPEKKIFRVDHYLGKEMIQNILSIRFGNSILSLCGITIILTISRLYQLKQ